MKIIYILVLGMIFVSDSRAESGPFAPIRVDDGPKVELITKVFTINEQNPYPTGVPSDYKPLSYHDELINSTEFALIRFFQKRGVDFIGVDGSYLSLPKYADQATSTLRQYKYHIIVTQTESNLLRIEKILALHKKPVHEPAAQ